MGAEREHHFTGLAGDALWTRVFLWEFAFPRWRLAGKATGSLKRSPFANQWSKTQSQRKDWRSGSNPADAGTDNDSDNYNPGFITP